MIKLRPADRRDAQDLLAWRNDPLSRSMSMQVAPIALEEHMTWYERALTNTDIAILIAESDGEKVGMVRFQRDGSDWEASINVNPAHRAQGFGRHILALGICEIRQRYGNFRIIARVKPENLASLRVFHHCGFRRQENQDGFDCLILGAEDGQGSAPGQA